MPEFTLIRLKFVIHCLTLFAIFSPISPVRADEPVAIEYEKQILPILADNCFACHGRDEEARATDLRIDSAEEAYKDHGGLIAISPGSLENSELWLRVTSDDPDLRMPPADSNKTLSAEQIELLGQWIQQGAPYAQHWAFSAPVARELPSSAELQNIQNPIDAFIRQRLMDEGLSLSTEADRRTLIRRVAFVTTGLPPTPDEVTQFVNDTHPDAYGRMVDRYLSSPHYGEEMARHWLDVARYADTHGMHLDNERHMWAYRDWVVNAFNDNQPFDQFTIEQLAGDLLDEPTQDQLVATGYNRCNVTSSEGGSINEELLYRYAVDRASTTIQTWTGLTGGCAVCHDHKFDPISQKEFYSFYAFFNSAADPAMDGNSATTPPILKLETAEHRQQLDEVANQLKLRQSELESLAAKVEYHDPALDSTAAEDASQRTEIVWLDDAFPDGGRTTTNSAPTQFASADDKAPVFSGQRSLKRTDKGLAQDVWDQASTPLVVPQDATIFAYVWIDPDDSPKAIMLQFHREGWLHRANWGDFDAIPWGKPDSHEKVNMGSLPASGEWVRLEIPAEKIGLNAGDMLTGFALTQFGGTVYWDKMGILGDTKPANDPSQSLLAWWKQAAGKDVPGLPKDIQAIAKKGPDGEASADERTKLQAYYVQHICQTTKPHFAEALASIAELNQRRDEIQNSIPTTFVYKDLEKPREAFVMLRGAYNKPGEKVEPDVPAVFPPLQKANPDGPATRLDLAQWLVSDQHPLTARVTVNRFWQQVFGVGLVKTSYDFGTQGELPSHPELLDWLAIHFREQGWNVKQLMRLMLTSQTFRQSSAVTDELLTKDPMNRLLARGPRLRLDAEQIRDNALFVSGLLDLTMGGKGVRTYQPENIWEPVGFAGSNTRFYKRDSGSALYRRSIYTFFKRTAPPPFMSNFDAPNREQFCTIRERSNTPLQALQLMNDVQHVEAARSLAERMLREGGDSPEQRIDFAFQTVIARSPQDAEMEIVVRQLDLHMKRYAEDAEAAGKLISQGESKPHPELNPSQLAAYTLVANMLLNLDETVTRN